MFKILELFSHYVTCYLYSAQSNGITAVYFMTINREQLVQFCTLSRMGGMPNRQYSQSSTVCVSLALRKGMGPCMWQQW